MILFVFFQDVEDTRSDDEDSEEEGDDETQTNKNGTKPHMNGITHRPTHNGKHNGSTGDHGNNGNVVNGHATTT